MQAAKGMGVPALRDWHKHVKGRSRAHVGKSPPWPWHTAQKLNYVYTGGFYILVCGTGRTRSKGQVVYSTKMQYWSYKAMNISYWFTFITIICKN